jgi:hypothetical protein
MAPPKKQSRKKSQATPKSSRPGDDGVSKRRSIGQVSCNSCRERKVRVCAPCPTERTTTMAHQTCNYCSAMRIGRADNVKIGRLLASTLLTKARHEDQQ